MVKAAEISTKKLEKSRTNPKLKRTVTNYQYCKFSFKFNEKNKATNELKILK